MSYQVLARKWRPRTFADLVGQEHVVRALINGLDRGRLHHAYLFTGTRGVGKTTLARILAKTLNCEEGVSATPCGVCAACREIDDGRFVDLLEVDAASRTKVEQTRELLDNVPFAPVRGRHKVYLIDEVHMFSASSFNALLKTLEEPPPHVKFVLATTDPQKVPATVLSRCLQFNLKRLLPEQIQERFVTVLTAEGVVCDEPALRLLARAADGSMRDGLSLLDQAIAYGAGTVRTEDVRAMLGVQGGELALDVLEALAAGDAPRVLAEIGRIAERTPDFAAVLDELIALLHRVALAQQVAESLGPGDPEHERLAALAARLPAEDVQLFYQVLLTGQEDLPLAPDPRSGLEMVLLRALAFRPDDGPQAVAGAAPAGAAAGAAAPGTTAAMPSAAGGAAEAAGLPGRGDGQPLAVRTGQSAAEGGPAAGRRPAAADGGAPVSGRSDGSGPAADGERRVAGAVAEAAAPGPGASPAAGSSGAACAAPGGPGAADAADAPAPDPLCLQSAGDWPAVVAGARLSGLAAELARHCGFIGWDGAWLELALDADYGHLRAAGAEQRLGAALAERLGREVRLRIRVGTPPQETPAKRQARDAAERLAAAEQALHADPVARSLRERFDADWIPGSISVAE